MRLEPTDSAGREGLALDGPVRAQGCARVELDPRWPGLRHVHGPFGSTGQGLASCAAAARLASARPGAWTSDTVAKRIRRRLRGRRAGTFGVHEWFEPSALRRGDPSLRAGRALSISRDDQQLARSVNVGSRGCRR